MTYDAYDAEWEDPNTGRTVSLSTDPEFCEVCDKDYDEDGNCSCED